MSDPGALARDCRDGFVFLHVVANEGGSSGGHAAIRFAAHTFHFQRTDDRLLRLVRDDSDRFVYEYAYLENRDIDVQCVPTDPVTRQALLDSFNERYLVQAERIDLAGRLHDDVDLLAALAAAERTGDPRVPISIEGLTVEGAGYFFERVDAPLPAPTTESEPSHALLRLRAGAVERYGNTYLAERTRDLRGVLDVARLSEDEDSIAVDFARDVIGPDTVAKAVVDALAELAALRVVAAGLPLRRPTYAVPTDSAFRLSAAAAAGLRAYADRLSDGLLELLGSQRSDRGYPLLVGLARLLAIEQSLANGSVVFLDAYPEDAAVLAGEQFLSRLGRHPELLDDAAAELEAAMGRISEGDPVGERDYAAVEAAANRLFELQRAAAGGGDLRVAGNPMLPRLGAPIALHRDAVVGARGVSSSGADGTDGTGGAGVKEPLRIALAQARARAAAYDGALNAEYGYHLIRRNCVTEIFRTIDDAWPAAPVRESVARLGGYVDPDAGLHFVPFAAAKAVGLSYAVRARTTIPSYRNLRLARMVRSQPPAFVYLREFNTLTSSIYEREPDESLFALYSDSPALLRPLFGAVNLATGVVQSAVGLARIPLDGPTAFLAGLRGVVFSLPELAFVHLRRGTRAYVDAAEIAALDEHAIEQASEQGRP